MGLLLSPATLSLMTATTPPALFCLESYHIDVALKSKNPFHFLTTNMLLVLVRHHITD